MVNPKNTYFGAFRGNTLCGVAEVEENSKYLNGCARILRVQVSWQCNEEAFLEEMLCSLAAKLDSEWICIDVHERLDYNLPVYKRIGFCVSMMTSPVGEGYCVLTARKEDLLHSKEK